MGDAISPAGGGYQETRSEVRYGETDQMGYAHHANAVVWFELGRVSFMRAVGLPYSAVEARGLLMPVVRLELRYHQPGRFEDVLIIQTRLAELGKLRVVFENRVLREAPGGERTLLAEGRVELACVGRDGKPVRMPEDLRAGFEKHVHRGGAG
ncbi:MAG: acyl-CoA thioesterase [Planctomycetes bacterium]|nr:acyl-CoA thioesterase [Planctomycetota bacterium]